MNSFEQTTFAKQKLNETDHVFKGEKHQIKGIFSHFGGKFITDNGTFLVVNRPPEIETGKIVTINASLHTRSQRFNNIESYGTFLEDIDVVKT